MVNLEKKLKTIIGGIIGSIIGGDVLDVGSGRGEFIHIIKEFKSFNKITANDIEQRSGDFIKEHFKDIDIDFVKADAGDLPFNDGSYDTVCISNSLHHLPELEKILAEMKRVLRDGGNFIINEMFSDAQDEAQMSHVLLHHWFAKIDKIFGRYHDETFKRKQIEKIVKKLELSDHNIIEYCWPIPDTKDTKLIEERTKLIDIGLKQLEGKDEFEPMKTEGKKIREYIEANGFASATSLFIVGIK
ncbi:MAG: class I SAM-dependent methyltransferase [Candidatus Cloacimonetes bacterium]|nr:class I SAM-dependent methyltransferase [Candidatus Cloacimonadota bacterium]